MTKQYTPKLDEDDQEEMARAEAEKIKMKPAPNLIRRVYEIKCMLCYDLGQIIDPFDQGKRKTCICREGEPVKHWPCPCLAEDQITEKEEN